MRCSHMARKRRPTWNHNPHGQTDQTPTPVGIPQSRDESAPSDRQAMRLNARSLGACTRRAVLFLVRFTFETANQHRVWQAGRHVPADLPRRVIALARQTVTSPLVRDLAPLRRVSDPTMRAAIRRNGEPKGDPSFLMAESGFSHLRWLLAARQRERPKNAFRRMFHSATVPARRPRSTTGQRLSNRPKRETTVGIPFCFKEYEVRRPPGRGGPCFARFPPDPGAPHCNPRLFHNATQRNVPRLFHGAPGEALWAERDETLELASYSLVELPISSLTRSACCVARLR